MRLININLCWLRARASRAKGLHCLTELDMQEHSTSAVKEYWADLKTGIMELIKAYDFAHETQFSVWDLAISRSELGDRGLSVTDLRWLVVSGLAVCQREVTRNGDKARVFSDNDDQHMLPDGCFVLTPFGFEFLKKVSLENCFEPPKPDPPFPVHSTPYWDADRHELWYDARLVKRFRLPSPNQERIVTAFNEESWPPRIDDPLPPVDEQNPKQRLHDTVRSLNRHHKYQLLRFSGDGTGEGIRWDPTNLSHDKKTQVGKS